MTPGPDSPSDSFPSLAAFRQAHVALLSRYRAGVTASLLDEIESLVARGHATGAILDEDSDRWEAQGLLDYWISVLYRSRRTPADGTLQPFDPALAPELPENLCPYRGLEPLREPQQWMFFGRSRVIADLLARISVNRLLVISGSSGSGKSSLVPAGLVPLLRTGRVPKDGAQPSSDQWQFLPSIVPGANPLLALASAVLGPGATADDRQREAARFADPMHLARSLDARGTPVLVAVDQFEEVFTLCPDEAMRRSFADNLIFAARSPGPAHRVVMTMRSDFEPQVAALPALQDLFERAQYRVPPFNAAELREVIERPAALIGLKFEEGIVDRLVSEILGEPAGMPLLQFALLKLWQRRDRNRITLEAYRRVGGPLQALERSAEELYASLLPEEQITARRIMMRIVRPGNSLEVTSSHILRESVHGSEPRDRVDRALDKLIDAGLLHQSGGPDPAEVQVEVAHEALLRNWPRLVGWLDDERVRLRRRFSVTAAAQQWATHGKDPGALLGGSLLEEARTYDDLDMVERAFLAASQAEEQRIARHKDRAFRTVVALLVLVVALAVGALFFALRLRTALAAEREQSASLKLALEEADALMKQRSDALEQAKQWSAAANTAVQAAALAAEAIDQQQYEMAKSLIRETQTLSGAYRRPAPGPGRAGSVTTAPSTAPPDKPLPPAPPGKQMLAAGRGVPDAGMAGPEPSLLDGLVIRASAEKTDRLVEKTNLPLYQFKIWLDGTPRALARVKSVQYEFNHPTFPNKTQRSDDRRSRFEQGYQGWGCLSAVKVTVTPVDPRVGDSTVDFDMCAAVSFRYKK